MKSMTIGRKLFLSFGAALALTLVVSLIALLGIGSIGGTLDKVIKVHALKRYLASDINTRASEALSLERGILVRAYMKDQATAEKYAGQFGENEARLNRRIKEFAPLVETVESRRLVDQLQALETTIRQNHEEFMHLVRGAQIETAVKLFIEKVVPPCKQVAQIAETLVQQQSEFMANVRKSAETSVAQSRWISILMIALSLVVAAVVVFVVRQINRGLRRIIVELGEGATQVAAAAGQVSSSSQSLAQGASEQAASIEETSASSEEIHSMAQKNADNSRIAAESMVEANQHVAQANQDLDQMVISMNEINASSDKISKIIKVIDEIAFQTNILALNAAVEAARAGEAGMGFAVVADEVRNLAQRCAQAAKDTASLIEESIAKSTDGKQKLERVAIAVKSITGSAEKVKMLVEEVKLGSDEQSRGIEQVSKAISQMEKVSQSTAANAEESASASEELNAQSNTLREIVTHLNGMVGGGPEPDDRISYQRPPHTAIGRKTSGETNAPRPPHKAGGPRGRAPVGKSPNSLAAPVPVSAKHEFPLDEDFKEF